MKRFLIYVASVVLLVACGNTDGNCKKQVVVPDRTVIVFQGDSVTDTDRFKDRPDSYGSGYVLMIAGEILAQNPNKDIRIYNRGVSGNKVFQMAERWQQDCLDLKPDVLSVMIGINDFWHTLYEGDARYYGTVEDYEDSYRALLRCTVDALPEVKLVIGEPFVLYGEGINRNPVEWTPFSRYQAVARKLAEEFGAVFIPYQRVFDQACLLAPPTYWAFDGIHPTPAGYNLMKNAWIDAVSGQNMQ